MLTLPILATVVAIISAAAGVWLLGHARHTRVLIPLSGGLLIGVAAFGLIPELVVDIGWVLGLLLVVFGYALLKSLDRFAFSVCPSCAHDHSHESCDEPLHGFAGPLLIATAIHAFVDGWGLVAVQKGLHTPGSGTVFAAALFLHKIPEGLALGTMLRASVDREVTALALCAAVELDDCRGRGCRVLADASGLGELSAGDCGRDFSVSRRARGAWSVEKPGRCTRLHPRAGWSGRCGDSAAGVADGITIDNGAK